jgi:branched-chain amino acid transport system substrate-binding protein
MKKFAWMILVLSGMVLTSFVTGFAQTQAPYLLGFTLDLTGLRAELAKPMRSGALIRIDEINEAGGINGRPLKAIFYDGESNPVKNVQNEKRLIEVDKAVATMGFSAVDASMASAQIAEDGKILLYSGSPSIVTGKPPKKWMFTVVPDQRVASIPILLKNLLARGSKKVGYIYIDTAMGNLGVAAFNWSSEKLGITPAIVEKYEPSAVDVSPQLAHIKASGADGLLVTGNLADTVRVIKTARDLGIEYPIVSDYAVVGPEFITLSGKYGEGIVTTSLKTLVAGELLDSDPQKKVCMDLYSKYTKQYGAFSLYAGHTWDQVNMVAMALRKIDPKLDPTKEKDLEIIRSNIRDNLEKLRGIVGQNGVFNYSETDHIGLAEGCYVPVVVQGGKWKLYQGK